MEILLQKDHMPYHGTVDRWARVNRPFAAATFYVSTVFQFRIKYDNDLRDI